MIRELKSLVGFLTVIPVGMESMETVSKYFFLCPLVALIIGAVAGTVGWVSNNFFPQPIVGFLVLASVQIMTGFHHFDGLLDLSDAVMVRGEPAKRLEVMHDKFTGAAAVGAGVIVLLTTGLSFGYFVGLYLLRIVLVSEIMAKESMVLTAYFGKTPPYKGMGYYIVKSMKKNNPKTLLSLALSAVMAFLLLSSFSAVVFVGVLTATIVSATVLATYANKTFGAVTGDVLGAANELIRMISLLVILATVSAA